MIADGQRYEGQDPLAGPPAAFLEELSNGQIAPAPKSRAIGQTLRSNLEIASAGV
jgi:hypothetical protein